MLTNADCNHAQNIVRYWGGFFIFCFLQLVAVDFISWFSRGRIVDGNVVSPYQEVGHPCKYASVTVLSAYE